MLGVLLLSLLLIPLVVPGMFLFHLLLLPVVLSILVLFHLLVLLVVLGVLFVLRRSKTMTLVVPYMTGLIGYMSMMGLKTILVLTGDRLVRYSTLMLPLDLMMVLTECLIG